MRDVPARTVNEISAVLRGNRLTRLNAKPPLPKHKLELGVKR
jgi:hypothetical protein